MREGLGCPVAHTEGRGANNLSGNPSFRQLLGRVRTTALEAYAHQELPFERLVEELQPVRDLSRTPVFQVLFQLRNLPDERVDANEDLRMAEADFDSGSAKLNLALDIVNKPEGLSCVAEYNTDLFDAASIARLLNHYENLLRGLLDNPNARLSELPLLTEVERKQLLLDWNETHADYPQHATVQSLFEAQVESTPDAIALIFKDEQLTYAELNAKSNRLAHHLIALGVGPEVLAGVCLERSIDMIVALLAILKAGGAYLPLDAGYPKARLAFMLEDSNAPVLIAQKHLQTSLPQHQARHSRCPSTWLPGHQPQIERESRKPGVCDLHLGFNRQTERRDDSTQRALTEHMLAMQNALRASTANDRVLQFASDERSTLRLEQILPSADFTAAEHCAAWASYMDSSWLHAEPERAYSMPHCRQPRRPLIGINSSKSGSRIAELALGMRWLRLVITGGEMMLLKSESVAADPAACGALDQCLRPNGGDHHRDLL